MDFSPTHLYAPGKAAARAARGPSRAHPVSEKIAIPQGRTKEAGRKTPAKSMRRYFGVPVVLRKSKQ
jgi:hypothetical protein